MERDREPVIVSAVRTAIGKHRGALASVRADDLAARVIEAALERAPAARRDVSEVVLGSTNQAGEDNRNVARMAALLAGLPYEVTGVTVNRLCGSGLEAIVYAARAVSSGDHDVVVAGGVESMTRAPYVMAKSEQSFARGAPKMWDTSIGWRFENAKMAERFPLEAMGETAENVAEKHGVTRAMQDAFALESHRRAVAAWEAGKFRDEVVPVMVAQPKGAPTAFERDECPRPDASLEGLAKLPAIFKKGGSVTAGSSSPINDGAAAVVVTSRGWAERNGVEVLASVKASAVHGVEPGLMGIGPIGAVRRVLGRAGWPLESVELVELNEAFAAQAVACVGELGLDASRVNVNGGAIAIGHPIGASGARITATLVHEMKRRDARRGLASLCIGVGQGIAVVFERA